jgi:acyl-CoA dehydrogenase
VTTHPDQPASSVADEDGEDGIAQARALVGELADALLAKHCTDEVREAAEAGAWPARLWDELAAAGLTLLDSGDQSADLDAQSAVTVLQAAGRAALPVPLAEAMFLGPGLFRSAGADVPPGLLGVAVPTADDKIEISGEVVSGRLARVPWGRRATHIAGLTVDRGTPYLYVVEKSAARIERATNLAGDARDSVSFDEIGLRCLRLPPDTGAARELWLRGQLSRAALMSGAMQAVLEMTTKYVRIRQQFGKPLVSFQAIAHRLVRMAEEVELATLATSVAAARFHEAGLGAALEVGSAKGICVAAADEVVAAAHQLHGAIGMTREYPLHHFTRRLRAWSFEWGTGAQCGQEIGALAARSGAERLWPLLTGTRGG